MSIAAAIPDGTSVLVCPICAHTFDVPERAPSAQADAIGSVMGLPGGALADIHHHQNLRRLEHDLDDHFRKHPPQEWLPRLMQLQATVFELTDALTQLTAMRT